MSQHATEDRLVTFRRELHRRPEPAWREFWTTARIVEELERIGVDEIHVGPDALATDERMGVPDDEEIDRWFERAREAGVREDLLEPMAGGYTGAVAVLRRGEGPTVALRVDVDGLPRAESDDDHHHPAREGFRSVHEGAMHACGHDGHTAIGLGVLERVKESDFRGTLKVVFQPAEEVVGGGKAVAKSGHLDDVDYLLALHLGLNHPTGEVVAGIDGFLAVSHVDVEFHGESTHAGGEPSKGRNAVQALATAVENLYGIARHEAGGTRVNAGKITGGTAANIVPEYAHIEGEVRGETTELMEYMKDRAREVVEGAAAVHDCEVEFETGPEAPGGESDDAIVDVVAAVAGETGGVETVTRSDHLGGSEDATYLMKKVQDAGGLAAYVCVGTDHPGGHHTATFDVDERSLPIGVDVLAGAIQRIARDPPDKQ
jgi:aminobenzoyl-glutamate utilization protein A